VFFFAQSKKPFWVFSKKLSYADLWAKEFWVGFFNGLNTGHFPMLMNQAGDPVDFPANENCYGK